MLGFAVLALLIIPFVATGNDLVIYTVSGDSMSPTLVSGDRVIVSPGETVQRGDLVAIRFRHSPTPLVKRAVAVEGDKVEFRDNAIFVNSARLRDFDEQRWKSTVIQLERNKWIVPPKNLFVLGDNAADSRDSRRLGLLSIDQVEGKVIEIVRKSSR